MPLSVLLLSNSSVINLVHAQRLLSHETTTTLDHVSKNNALIICSSASNKSVTASTEEAVSEEIQTAHALQYQL